MLCTFVMTVKHMFTTHAHTHTHTQKALARAASCTDLPLWTENVALPGPQVLRTASERDGDLIRLTFTKEVTTPPGKIPTRRGVVSFLLEAAGSVIGRFAGNSGERLDQHRVERSVETLSRYCNLCVCVRGGGVLYMSKWC